MQIRYEKKYTYEDPMSRCELLMRFSSVVAQLDSSLSKRTRQSYEKSSDQSKWPLIAAEITHTTKHGWSRLHVFVC